MFTLSDYADISRVVNDPQYAKSKGLIVKSQKLNSVKDIENKLKSIPSDDPDWREMRVSSLTDLILQKLLRVKQIEDNKGKTLVSEGIDANYFDMVNYAIFALIHLELE